MRKSLVPVSLLLLAAVTGCNHKEPIEISPPTVALLQPTATLKDLPALPPVSMRPVQLGTQEAQEAPPKEKPRRIRVLHHHPKPAANPSQDIDIPAQTPSTSAPAPAAASAGQEPPESTPIGQLSAAPNATDVPSKQNIQQEITSTESGLNGIHRSLSNDEQQTAAEIRTFLSKAKNALQSGDLDGAHTLTVKARVLLAELNK